MGEVLFVLYCHVRDTEDPPLWDPIYCRGAEALLTGTIFAPS